MGKQIGIEPVTGTFGDINFYKSKGQLYVRMKPGPDKKQFKTSKAFAGSRKRSLDFGYASKNASALKTLIQQIEPRLAGNALYRLLFKQLRIMQALDTTHVPGEKILLAKHQKTLKNQSLTASEIAGEISRLFETTYEEGQTSMQIKINVFPTDSPAEISGATHYRWKVGLIIWNPNTKINKVLGQATELAPLNDIPYSSSLFTFEKQDDENNIILPVLSFQCYNMQDRLSSEKMLYTKIL